MDMAKRGNDAPFFGLELNPEQEEFKNAIMDDNNQVVICNATAGSGKTLISTACARLLTAYNGYDGAVYVFATPQEHTLGFRPGGTQDKEADYIEPLLDALITINENPRQAISSDISDKNGTSWITARSGTFMRGINLKKKVVIIDEVENYTIQEIKKIISRCHDDCKVILIGCVAQTDIQVDKSCFTQLIDYLSQFDKVKICELKTSYRGWLASAIDKL